MSENGEQRKKTAYLAMPAHAGMTTGAARGFFRATAGGLDLALRLRQSSLINTNCNGLWAAALNAVQHGERIDYFAMLHSDVQPGDYWLDTLVAELEAKGLDVLAAAVPIKDQRGLTSTAVGNPGQSPDWRPLCRITMRELYRLPETFTSADLGHPDRPLLINTGCWVCRFDPSWARYVHFGLCDRIVFDPERKAFVVENVPEDWYFARQLWEKGLKVGVTRKLGDLTHHGHTDYAAGGPWGEYEYDREFLSAPALRIGPAGEAGGFPWDVGGWLTESEGRELTRLAEGRRVLEVGSYLGRSTVCLARSAASVVAVDPFDGRATPAPRATLDAFLANLRRYRVDGKVRPRVGTFAEVAPQLAGEHYDLIFVDADHRREAVTEDIALALPLLAPNGLLAFHDYGRPQDPGVRQAVEAELLAAGGELLSLTESLAVVRPPARVAPPAPETSLALAGVTNDG